MLDAPDPEIVKLHDLDRTRFSEGFFVPEELRPTARRNWSRQRREAERLIALQILGERDAKADG